MNAFKKIKYFKLDSMNPKDVEDYMRSFNSSFDGNPDDINLLYRTLQTVGILCEQKCRALHGLGKLSIFTMVFQAGILISRNLAGIFNLQMNPLRFSVTHFL